MVAGWIVLLIFIGIRQTQCKYRDLLKFPSFKIEVKFFKMIKWIFLRTLSAILRTNLDKWCHSELMKTIQSDHIILNTISVVKKTSSDICLDFVFICLAELFCYFRFRIDNTDHIIDVVHQPLPQQYSQINIICPHYPRNVQVILLSQVLFVG